ncbi:hypothetical protein CYLTODRAFT_406279 [Cylindrobasidium torrendii FP15055 ss-10]|uniref:Uncharacterized protein n=1 Tax=Cylindrobasidium torrendii FP15055 ss-10 TaxID=1314674 RepID=A0A0D7BUL2_9AGAR|nr:hypothetical protein CYLTODRAFT_406279 [Cylindrobasidium torrendii FP15055 ss-10]
MAETLQFEDIIIPLLRTNSAPSELEERAISESLREFKARLMGLSTRVARDLDSRGATQHEGDTSTLQDIWRRRDDALKGIQQCKQVLNPVRRLPGEVLARIFHNTVDFPMAVLLNDTPGDGQKWWELDVPPFMMWSVELVCKAWRSAALADPMLWTYINIVVPVNASGSSTASGLSRLATQLSRTHLSPLFVSIVTSAQYAAEIDALPHTLIAVLLPFAQRIEELYVHLPLELIWSLAPLRYRLHSLAYLSIVNTPYQDNPIRYPIDVFSECPRLRRMNIGDDTEPTVHFMLPWHILQYVTLEHALLDSEVQPTSSGPMPRSIRHVLRQAREILFFQVTLETSDSTLDTTPILCESLWSLTITCYPPGDEPGQQHPLIQLLHGLHLPLLFELSIDSIYHPRMPTAVFASVANLIERSRCPLSALAYGGGDIEENDLIRILHVAEEMDSLRLTMVGSSLTDRLVKVLAIQSTATDSTVERPQAIIAPCLETLALSGNMQFSAENFMEMVRTRWDERSFKELELEWIVGPRDQAHAVATAFDIEAELEHFEGLFFTVIVRDQYPKLDDIVWPWYYLVIAAGGTQRANERSRKERKGRDNAERIDSAPPP